MNDSPGGEDGSSNGFARSHTNATHQARRAEETKPTQAQRERAQQAASAYAWRLCDQIDRAQQALSELHRELEDAAAVCRLLFDNSSRRQEHDTLERAERILRKQPRGQ